MLAQTGLPRKLRDDLLAVFLHNQCIDRADRAGFNETSLVDVWRFVFKRYEVGVVNLINLRREVRAVAGSDAQCAVNFNGDAADGALLNVVAHSNLGRVPVSVGVFGVQTITAPAFSRSCHTSILS